MTNFMHMSDLSILSDLSLMSNSTIMSDLSHLSNFMSDLLPEVLQILEKKFPFMRLESSARARLEIFGLEARLGLENFFKSGLEARLGLDSSRLELGSVLKI